MSSLQQLDIFELCPLIINLNCKISAVTEYDAQKQLLCLVSEDNDILLRYTTSNQEVLKLITWFRRTNNVIHDVCFDPTGTWLLVLCFDNTLHIVPALVIVDKTFNSPTNGTQLPYSTTQVTSYIIPFVGPHECPNSKKCPNRSTGLTTAAAKVTTTTASTQRPNEAKNASEAPIDAQAELPEADQVLSEKVHKQPECENIAVTDEQPTLEAYSSDVPLNMLPTQSVSNLNEDKTGNNQMMATSFMASTTCPFPLSVVWWQTMDGVNRAIIGYSDGSICFVALSPNCPFVASTTIEAGSVVKLLICKDNTFESVMLLITSSLKQQFKLLLEQKAIKYIYPGDISPSTALARENDWQIIMPLKTNSNCSDPASDSSQLEEDVFIKSDEATTDITTTTTTTVASTSAQIKPTAPPPPPPNNAAYASYVRTSEIPPPPPYSVAINRHLDSAPMTTSASNTAASATILTAASGATGIRVQQQQLPELDDFNSARAGILPAARARLASLKSLGSKKLNAIKMRLSDNRQKFEEYIPENTLGSFAIMDSPSLTPEILGNNTLGSFYTIQNLRSTYLLSALHCQSNSLSVHSIDINLKPLFLYKIPKNCYDILISSNILYAIQYVDIKQQRQNRGSNGSYGSVATSQQPQQAQQQQQPNTEKENRDTDLEKEAKMLEVLNLSDDDDKFLPDADAVGIESVDTSATTSGPTTNSSSSLTACNLINAVGVISSAMASLRTNDDDTFNETAQLGMFRFEHETVLNLYQMATFRTNESTEHITKEEKAKAFDYKEIRSPMDYVKFYKTADVREEYSLRQMEIMKKEFPKINYDPCYVITNKNVYYIQLKKEPFAIFLDAALAGEWAQCREFTNTFDLTFEACIEFAGDYLLRCKKVTQALLTYNTARIKPIRTALKLAMFGQTCALMHLCAMALKATYVLKSKHFCHPITKTLLTDITYRHSEDVRNILPQLPSERDSEIVNEGKSCSDYSYGVDEPISNLQMSPSSQFHLANLLLITLAEKAVNDKNYLPLWNFLVTNTKYHTNMTSVVLCQSGLFSAALILAKARGVCIDTFLALNSVAGQEFGWYTELNVCLYNLSEPIFAETITYMPLNAVDYFAFIQEKLPQIRQCVLQRLEQQLNPFTAMLRPIVSHTSANSLECNNLNDNKTFLFEFCKNLIETYLAVLIHMESQRSKHERITNALTTFRISYEDNQFAIETTRFKPISAGCAHCACVVDGVAYFWGSNGVPCDYSVRQSSDPPEPPHAVKSLDLIAQLNLEVHAVKCGRMHTLILTNNGLYAVGNNNLLQLGIGKHMQMSLQPMLVQVFDGMNITILETGQYHNAAVANGLLYTWGWGVYGQLGHGDTESVAVPKLVAFFKYKHVVQVSLGHAHSLVLCKATNNPIQTELYVFGSNHFGQLGVNANGLGRVGSHNNSNEDSIAPDDEFHCATHVKSVLPIKLDVCTARLRLIHTKFFTNLVVDENERMYTWGSSPQALRLANQIKRRANAKQKIEEHQRREMNKRFEATMGNTGASTSTAAIAAVGVVRKTELAVTATDVATVETPNAFSISEIPNEPTPCAATEIVLAAASDPDETPVETTSNCEPTATHIAEAPLSGPITEQIVRTNVAEGISIQVLDDMVDEIVVPTKPMEALPLRPPAQIVTQKNESEAEQPQKQHQAVEPDPCEHMTPHLVDTSEVAGQILQVSSGLFHFALISSSCTLYTWGKNLEHQLGTEDKERRAVNKPAPIDSIERPMYVDCGADFTLVMTTEYVVKAFGGNSNGQCGRDLGASIDKMKQRVVCLPTTKRLMRFESQCVEAPVEINLPRPRIRLDNKPVRYLKSIPHYQPYFLQECGVDFNDGNYERPSPSQQYKSTTQADSSSDNPLTGQDSEDLISSLENLSNNDANLTDCNVSPAKQAAAIEAAHENSLSGDVTPDEQSYVRLLATDNAEQSLAAAAPAPSTSVHKLQTTNVVADNTQSTLTSDVPAAIDDDVHLRNYIHYCLYVFHGLYNPDKVREFAKNRIEYRIRMHMLNFKFIDAFALCLQDCDSAARALKIFEYFSKDTGYVPMRRQDLKYLIYQLLQHFLVHKFDMLECERYFLADLDYYLLELAYVLYFNNNNTVLEQNLNQKFKSLLTPHNNDDDNDDVPRTTTATTANVEQQQHQQTHKLENTDVIFDSLSVKFKTIVCQRLMKHCSRFSNNETN